MSDDPNDETPEPSDPPELAAPDDPPAADESAADASAAETDPPLADVVAPGPGHDSMLGPVAVVVSFFVALTGLFVLPLNANPLAGPDFGFVEIRSFVALAVSRSDNAFQPFSMLAAFWWRFGALIVVLVLGVLVLVVLSTSDRRPFGWVITVIAVIGGLLHGLALAQSTDLRNGAQLIVGYAQANFYDHAGIGVWVSLAGFGLLAVAGVALAVLSAPATTADEPLELDAA